MSSLLAAIARSLNAHWKRGLIGLVAVIVITGAIVGTQSGTAVEDFSIPGTETQKAIDVLEAKFPSASGVQSQIVFSTQSGSLSEGDQRAAVQASLAAVRKLAKVTEVSDPFAPRSGALSRDGRTAFSTVTIDLEPADFDKAVGEKFVNAARSGEKNGVSVEMRGPLADIAAQQEAPTGELIGIALALILLTILFRSLAAMLVTLLGALVGVMISQLLLRAIAPSIGIPDFATIIAVMLGLGAGIDYALLILSRFREQLAAGDSPPEAAARANATSGVSVVAAGLIVMVAIAGLMAVGIPLVGKMGIGSAIAIAFVVISSVTVLPIFAGMLSKKLHPKDPEHVAKSERFEWWGRIIVAHPWRAIVSGGIVMLVLAVPITQLHLGQPDDGNQPQDTTQRKAYDMLARAFGPGFSGPLLLAIEAKDGGKVDQASLGKLRSALGDEAGIVTPVGPAIPNQQGTAAIMTLIPKTAPQDNKTSELVHRLRDDVIPASGAKDSLNVYVGGATAGFEDFSAKIASRLPVFIAIVIGLSILLLIAVFRSIWVPLASAVFNILSIGAAYGITIAVFQEGVGASLLGVDETVPIVSFVPLMMFAILFGLSMDYNVFLLSRIREAYFEGDSPKESVVHGLSRIAKVILTAGLIMASVFLAFVPGQEVMVKMFGFGLGAAILIDVLLIRMVVSPAIVTVLGDRAWWIPRWLDRIMPDVSLEGHHESRSERIDARG
jgi:RND superfamily putative drug exporter